MMKTMLAAVFAAMVGVTFVGAAFAEDVRSEAPASAPAAGGDVKKAEAKTEKKKKKHKKEHKETAEKKDAVEKK
jgi:hypothetical protein